MSADDEQVAYSRALEAEAHRYARANASWTNDEPVVAAAWLSGYAAGCKAAREVLRKAVGMAPLPAPGSEAMQ